MEKLPHGEYFEGIVQLRDVDEGVVEKVLKLIERDGRAVVTNIQRVRGGWDLFLSSQKYVRVLARKLPVLLGGVVKTTATLHTRDKTGRDLYRVTLAWRPLKVGKGDEVWFKGRKWRVLHAGEQVQIQDVVSGEKRRVKDEDVRKV